MNVISALAPVFALVLLGFLLLRFKFAEESFFHVAAKFVYWIGLPCLLFKNIAETTLTLSDAWRIFVIMSIASLLVAVLGTVAARMLKLAPARRKTFIHTSFHCNTAFVGLPVILYSLSSHPDSQMLIDMASMAVAPMIPIFNIMSIIVMRGTDGSGQKSLSMTLFRKILTNPQVLSCIFGLIVSFIGIRLPLALSRSLGSLGGMALPLALLSIGAGLNARNLRDSFSVAALAASFNVICLPLVGFALCRIWGLSPYETLIGLIFLACPTASSAYIYARQLNGDPAFAGNVILISTLISAPALWLVLFWGL
ncbi:MAG: AEC family transporter [Kiritimatiellae bacterium]|jgi:predicted permease|nr:AEC family transporter [Kiritimatiellia bacterium]